jgi:hypothetical protein
MSSSFAAAGVPTSHHEMADEEVDGVGLHLLAEVADNPLDPVGICGSKLI